MVQLEILKLLKETKQEKWCKRKRKKKNSDKNTKSNSHKGRENNNSNSKKIQNDNTDNNNKRNLDMNTSNYCLSSGAGIHLGKYCNNKIKDKQMLPFSSI